MPVARSAVHGSARRSSLRASSRVHGSGGGRRSLRPCREIKRRGPWIAVTWAGDCCHPEERQRRGILPGNPDPRSRVPILGRRSLAPLGGTVLEGAPTVWLPLPPCEPAGPTSSSTRRSTPPHCPTRGR